MAKLTKSQLLNVLAEKTGMSKKEVTEFMDTFAELAYSEVRESGEFIIPVILKFV